MPQNEIVTYKLLQIQNQRYFDQISDVRDFFKLDLATQHQMMLAQIGLRYKVYEWFIILKQLINDDQKRTQQRAGA